MTYPVVVGVDASESSRYALDWAADEAALCGLPLRIVHAWLWHPYDGTPIPVAVGEGSEQAVAKHVLDEAEARVRDRHPDLDVTSRLDHRSAGSALVEECAEASMVVVGSRGHGGFTGLLLGSVSLFVAGRADCPVVVVRRRPGELRGPEQSPEVLLGVDGSEPGQAAIEFAFAEASRLGVRLRALHAWTRPLPAGPGVALPLVHDPQEMGREAARVLAEALAGWAEKYPDVEVVTEVSPDSAAKALVARSPQADLLVVGAHRLQGPVGLALGRVNHAVLHHAHCPVAVIPEHD